MYIVKSITRKVEVTTAFDSELLANRAAVRAQANGASHITIETPFSVILFL